jgi:hypothetical protein
MKTLNSQAVCLLLALSTQVLAQRFTPTEPDVFRTPSEVGNYPQYKQIAALGEKNSAYANIMLVGGRDTLVNSYPAGKVGTYNVVKSDSTVLGTVFPFNAPNIFMSDNDTIYDNSVTAVAVLDSFSDSKKTATAIFASLRKLVIMQIVIDNTNKISSKVLSNTNMPESMWEINGAYNVYTHTRRLALLGISQDGANKVYHLATGNPLSKNRNGRVDFFNITENSWALLQPNPNGLASGINGLVFNDSAYFGTDLAVIDNFDKKGGKALAVLLPNSKQFPSSALYLFQMDNDWTPSTKLPVVIAGKSKPWFEESDKDQKCGGLGVANPGDETPHLLVSCINTLPLAEDNGKLYYTLTIKDIVLDSNGNISNNNIFFSRKMSMSYNSPGNYGAYSNPISIKNHKNDLHSIFLIAASQVNSDLYHSMAIFTIMDADYSKNFSIEAGIQEAIVNIDSLFYKSGTTGFSAKTLFGLAQCTINSSKELLCLGYEKSVGSWSGIELSSSGNCNSYKACKKKDTIFVYVRAASETANTALRIPKNTVVPYYGQINLSNVKPLSYFKNPNLQNTKINWNTAGLKLSVLADNPEKGLLITPFSQNEGIDTLIFNLSISSSNSTIINNYPLYLHVADTAKILRNAIPANPGNDTVWNIAQRKYIAMPRSNSKGDVYTYDIAQDSLGAYAEIIGDYLHILRVDIMDVSLAYSENGQMKYRKITLMPEPKAFPPLKIANLLALNIKVTHISGGLQINGLNGEFELRAYNFKGEEIQKEKSNAKGSVFVRLRRNCPQIAQIRFNGEKISIFIPQ